MEITCCGVKYSTRNINTFQYFEKYAIKQNNIKSALKWWMFSVNEARKEQGKKPLDIEYFTKRKHQTFNYIEIYKLNCIKKQDINNPCRKAKILYYQIPREAVRAGNDEFSAKHYAKSQGDKKHLIDEQNLSGDDVLIFFASTIEYLENKPVLCPVKNIPSCRQIPWTYPEATSSTTAGVKYLGVNTWQNKHAYKSPVRKRTAAECEGWKW